MTLKTYRMPLNQPPPKSAFEWTYIFSTKYFKGFPEHSMLSAFLLSV